MQYKEILQPLVKCIREVFETQCDIKVTFKDSYQMTPGESWTIDNHEEMFISSVKLESSDIHCSIGFYFEQDVFLRFVSGMFGEEVTEMTEEYRDLAAEWLNITMGHIKGILNDEMKQEFTNTIPVNFVGHNLSIQTSTKSPMFVLPFHSEVGDFHVFLKLGKDGIVPWDNSFLRELASLPGFV